MDFQSKPKVQGNWKCDKCNKDITELPFNPTAGRPVYCFDCMKEMKGSRTSTSSYGGNGGARPARQMFKGNWKCDDCGNEIPELPFQPSGKQPLYCRTCLSNHPRN